MAQSSTPIAASAPVASTPPEGWTPLVDISDPTGQPAPSAIKVPKGADLPIRSWRQVLVEISLWLNQGGLLTPENCQFPASKKRNLYSSDVNNPRHPNGKPFRDLDRVILKDTGIVMDGNLSAKEVIRRTRLVLAHFNQDPSQVYLKLP